MYAGGVSINSQGKLPVLYEGAEFSISTWIYINDWNFRLGKNKHVISLGDDTADIIRIYLGGFKSKLNVQLNTDNNLAGTTRDGVFTTMQTDSDIGDNLYSANSCDLPEIQIQRWVNIVVAVNGKQSMCIWMVNYHDHVFCRNFINQVIHKIIRLICLHTVDLVG